MFSKGEKMSKKVEKKFDKKEYVRRYMNEKYDVVRIQVPKGQKEILKAEAEAEGKSLQQFIRDCIDEHRQRKA